MKLHFIEDKYDCRVLDQSEPGLFEVVTSLFQETARGDFKGHYGYLIRWLGTIKQNRKDLVNVTYEEKWRIEFDNAPNSVELLIEIIDSSFNAFKIVFNTLLLWLLENCRSQRMNVLLKRRQKEHSNV